MHIPVRLIERKWIAEGVMKITLALDGAPFDFKPGQFVHMALPELKFPDPSGAGRDFTISSLPNGRTISITIRVSKTPSGFKQTLLALPMVAKITVSGPHGGMPLPPESIRPIIFIAGGIGITAFRAKIRHILADAVDNKLPVLHPKTGGITLLWNARNRGNIPYLWEMRTLAHDHKERFELVEIFGTKINTDILKKYVSEDSDTKPLWQIAGHPEMVTSIRESLASLNVAEDNIDSESYTGYGSQTRSEAVDCPIAESTTLAEATYLSHPMYHGLLKTLDKSVMVTQTDTQGNITFVNDKFVEISGYAREELIGQNHRMVKSGHHSPEFYHEMWGTITSGQVWRGEVKNRAKDGSYWWADTNTAPVFDPDGAINGYVSVRFLITDRKTVEERLEAYHYGLEDVIEQRTKAFSISNEALRTEVGRRNELENELRARMGDFVESDRKKNEFIAILSHELRNPLSQVVITTELARLGLPVQCPVLIGHLDTIERESHAMKRLLDDLLDVSRIMRGKITLHRERINVAQIIRSIVDGSGHGAEAVRHTFAVTMPDEICIYADPVRVEQIFTNIINNAIKYSPAGGAISISAKMENSRVTLSIKDSGIGIDKANIDRVFELFSQSGSSLLPEKTGGLGIGLFISKMLAELHGGTLTVHSDGEGMGSEFTISLPPSSADTAPADIDAAQESSAPLKPGNGRKIMVIDDVAALANAVGILLSKMGYDTRAGYGGADALAIAREYQPDIVLLDISMPGMDGYETLRQLKTLPELSHTRFCAMSGFGQEHDRKRSLAEGFSAHLVKPLGARDLQKAIEG